MDSENTQKLSKEEIGYYQRQLIIPEFGNEAQLRLKNAKVLIIGMGGLGCPAAQYLVASGVGTIGIIDPDLVSESNLQRQVLYSVEDVGQIKIEVAKRKLKALNPKVEFITYPIQLTEANAGTIISEFDVVVDGTDNFPTRYLINDTCVIHDVPNVYASILRFEGQISVFNAPLENGKRSANYRDLFPSAPPKGSVPNCAEAGILGSVAGILGTYQANETIKLITGIGETLINKVLVLDLKMLTTQTLNLVEETSFPKERIQELDKDYVHYCGGDENISIDQFREMLTEGGVTIVDVRSVQEYSDFNIGGINIPLDEIEERHHELIKKPKIVFLCLSGQRSRAALDMMRPYHLIEAYHLEGGLTMFNNLT